LFDVGVFVGHVVVGGDDGCELGVEFVEVVDDGVDFLVLFDFELLLLLLEHVAEAAQHHVEVVPAVGEVAEVDGLAGELDEEVIHFFALVAALFELELFFAQFDEVFFEFENFLQIVRLFVHLFHRVFHELVDVSHGLGEVFLEGGTEGVEDFFEGVADEDFVVGDVDFEAVDFDDVVEFFDFLSFVSDDVVVVLPVFGGGEVLFDEGLEVEVAEAYDFAEFEFELVEFLDGVVEFFVELLDVSLVFLDDGVVVGEVVFVVFEVSDGVGDFEEFFDFAEDALFDVLDRGVQVEASMLDDELAGHLRDEGVEFFE